MPYVYMEELGEGMEEADVRSAEEYAALQAERDEAVSSRNALQENYDSLVQERDGLLSEMNDVKTKFADAFLSSPARAKAAQAGEMRDEEKPMTYDALFAGRNKYNAN